MSDGPGERAPVEVTTNLVELNTDTTRVPTPVSAHTVPFQAQIERAIQIAVREVANGNFAKSPECLENLERVIADVRSGGSHAKFASRATGILDDRLTFLDQYEKRRNKDLQAGRVLTQRHVMRLDELPGVRKHLTFLRSLLETVFSFEGWNPWQELAVQRVHAAVIARLLEVQVTITEHKRVKRKFPFDPDVVRSFSGGLNKRQVDLLLPEVATQFCTLRGLSREETADFFRTRLGYDEKEVKRATQMVSERIMDYMRWRIDSAEEGVKDHPMNIPGLRKFAFVQDSRLRTISKKGGDARSYLLNLFRSYLNMLNGLPSPLSRTADIPLWDGTRERPIEDGYAKRLKKEGMDLRKGFALVKLYTDRHVLANSPKLNYELVGRKGDPSRDVYAREWYRLAHACGRILRHLRMEDLHDEVANFISQRDDLNLPKVADVFSGRMVRKNRR